MEAVSSSATAQELPKSSRWSKFLAIIDKILCLFGQNFTADKLFSKKMQEDIDGGHCYGMSMGLLKQLAKETDHFFDPKRTVKALSKEEVVLLQLLQNLYVHLNRYGLSLVDAGCDQKDCQQVIDLMQEIEQAKEEIMGVSLSKKEEFQIASRQELAIRTYLAKNTDKSFRVDLYPPKSDLERCGHSIVLDLKHNGFYDIECGYYQFDSSEKCLDAFFDRMKTAYPQYKNGSWEFSHTLPPKRSLQEQLHLLRESISCFIKA